MSSNSAEAPPLPGTSGTPRRAWSMTTRLALIASLSSFLILALTSLFLYSQAAQQLRRENINFLREEVEILRELARFVDFDRMLAQETHVDTLGSEYVTHYVRLLRKDGTSIIETPHIGEVLPMAIFPVPVKSEWHGEVVSLRGLNGESFIGAAVRIDWSGNPGDEILHVALDVTTVENILASWRRKLAATLVVGFLFCSVIGYVTIRRGVRPLLDMTDKAGRISAANLDYRLHGADWPSELNTLAGALNVMLDGLQNSFTRLYGSVANLTHKLRTPLTILQGEAEVALSRERTADELREVLESSMEEYGRLSRLIDNIVFIAQAEAGKLQHVRIKIHARPEIDKVVDFYRPLAEEKGLGVSCEGDANLEVDPTLFRKAVASLLANALTYTSPGGTAAISIRQGDDRSTEVTVTDTGCGIPEKELEKIFDRFYRIYTTRFMDPHGTGLGLPIVKTIMDLHLGTISVLSSPGHGTTVTLRFPPPGS